MTDHITLPRDVAEGLLKIARTGYLELAEKYAGTKFENDSAYVEAKVRYEALRAALAGAAQAEPVAWVFQHSDGSWHDPSVTEHSSGMTPLYTAPQPAQPVAVPQELLQAIDDYAETRHKCGDWTYNTKTNAARERLCAMLAAAPTPPAATVPVLEPLTDEEIDEINFRLNGRRDLARLFARAVEAAYAAKLAKLNGVTPPAEGGV